MASLVLTLSAVLTRPWAAMLLCAAAVLLIAQIDYLTGYEFALSLLYVMPVGAATWVGGRKLGWLMASLSAVTWFFTDLYSGHAYSHPFYRYWEVVIHLITFGLVIEILLRLKHALARSDERFIMALEGMDAAICVADSHTGALLFANGSFRSTLGQALWHDDAASLWGLLGLPAGNGFDGISDELEGGYAGRTYLVRVRSLQWTSGRPVRLVTLTDITAHKQAEQASRRQREQMEQTSKLVAVGEMASMLAHEINQPLTAIVNYSRGCIRRLRGGDVNRQELLDIIQQSSVQAERAANILHRAREFVRKREPLHEFLELGSLARQAAVLVRDDLRRAGVEISIEVPERLPKITGDRSMVEQVLVNLLRNAVDAMADTAPERKSLRVVLSTTGDAVTVAVRDSGCGIPDEIMADLFKPFFSTKADGMGLGLSICRSIVEYHRGQLWASRNPQGGSTFQFTLPVEALP